MPFPWEGRGEDTTFSLYTNFISFNYLYIIDRKQLGQPFWIMTWVYYYLFNGIWVELDLDLTLFGHKNT